MQLVEGALLEPELRADLGCKPGDILGVCVKGRLSLEERLQQRAMRLLPGRALAVLLRVEARVGESAEPGWAAPPPRG